VYHVLVNRAAGNGRGAKVWKQVQTRLLADAVPHRVSFPLNESDSASHVRALLSDGVVTCLIIIGGDGTVHSVLSALVGSDLPVGIIPAGSGNDLVRALGIPVGDIDRALRLIRQGRTVHADVIQAGSRYCVTAVGAGIDGAVAHCANRAFYKAWLNQLRLGSVSYVIALLQTLLRFRPTDVQVTVDGDTVCYQHVWLVAVANVPSYGGGMRICPVAEPNDGELDVCIVHGLSRWSLLRIFPRVYRGRHVTHPAVTLRRGRHVSITADAALLAHADGELLGTTPLDLSVIPQALRLCADERFSGRLPNAAIK
jgi:diacylglycerol kinase (ATP)